MPLKKGCCPSAISEHPCSAVGIIFQTDRIVNRIFIILYYSARYIKGNIKFCRFTIHVLQLNNLKDGNTFLYYIFSDKTKTQQERMYFRMASITQDMRYHL